jgi:hypothetical protein
MDKENVPPVQVLERVDKLLHQLSPPKLDAMQILNSVDQSHEKDLLWAKESPLPFEKTELRSNGNTQTIEYEFILPPSTDRQTTHNVHERPIAIRSLTPLLAKEEIKLLKLAAENYWSATSTESSSRFTYQRKGNSEAHLSDVVNFSKSHLDLQTGRNITELIEDLLMHRVYPWVREAFLSNEKNVDADELGLYVYDSLFIRYNGTEANKNISMGRRSNIQHKIGAGQPLHRDLGYVSVNIMMNDLSEFEGGGTFFENQMIFESLDFSSNTSIDPLKPSRAGHALAHLSSDRHSGAATMDGVRDILVIFVAAAEINSRNPYQQRKAPIWERAARLKTSARSYCNECFATDSDFENMKDELVCRILHHRLAIESMPDDGEAWHYLGMGLLECSNLMNDNIPFQYMTILDLAIECLEEGTKYTPFDARLYNNIGIAFGNKLSKLASTNALDEQMQKNIHSKINNAYQRAVSINSICARVGCDVSSDFERACLNFGLYLSRQDNFLRAIDILRYIESTDLSSEVPPARRRVLEDALDLLQFCRKQIKS